MPSWAVSSEAIYETRHAAGEQIAAHRHHFAYAAVVLKGRYEEAGPDGVWLVESGDLVMHPPFHIHSNRVDRVARILNFALPHAWTRVLCAEAFGVLRLHDAGGVVRRAQRDVLDALVCALERAVPRRPVQGRGLADRLAEGMRAAPQARIASIARHIGVSPEHASRSFARQFGFSPSVFRAEGRLRVALQALAASSAASLAEIATSCGYADQAHFTRAVAAATGETPGRLRRALAGAMR